MTASESAWHSANKVNQPQSDSAKPQEQHTTSPDASADLAAKDLAALQEKLKEVTDPTVGAVMRELEVDLAPSLEDFADLSDNALVGVGDLDGDGTPEFILKFMRSESADTTNGVQDSDTRIWELFLLSWAGTGWKSSSIAQGFEPFEIQIVPSLFAGSTQLALVVYAGTTGIPYPSIYRMEEHAALLAWDGRSDDSEYQGYAHGKVEFSAAEVNDPPRLVSTGRADPGLLHFPVESSRGFDVRATYVWDGKAFGESKTEYSMNEDRALYQFISALHLHDFRAAYAMIDPSTFLKTDQPSLEIFRKQVEGTLPEFLDDQVFEVPEGGSAIANPFEFDLDMESKHYIYEPMFGPGPKYLLLGLERHEGARTGQ